MTSGDRDIWNLELLALSDRLRRRELSSEDVCNAMLDRIDRLDGGLHSFTQVWREDALAAARQSDLEMAKGDWRGPLHGIPIGVKDLFHVAGRPCTAGTLVYHRFHADTAATVVERLQAAGAVLIGMTHMTEAATMAHHPALPRPENPWKPDHWPGVSSSGSGAAVAARLCYGALGSDTGGSIRIPSAACGLSGIKPSWGRVSRHGMFPLAESFDHAGPLARSVADAAVILQVIAGPDARDPTAAQIPVPDYLADATQNLTDVTVGVDWDGISRGADPAVEQALKSAITVLEGLGATIRPIILPTAPLGDVQLLSTAEIAAVHAETFAVYPHLYGPQLRDLLLHIGQLPAARIGRAIKARRNYRGLLDTLFSQVDLLLTPMMMRAAPSWPEIEEMEKDLAAMMVNLIPFSTPFNISGHPALALPGGFDRGLPLGLQLVAGYWAEPLLIRVGRAFQSVTHHHQATPPLLG